MLLISSISPVSVLPDYVPVCFSPEFHSVPLSGIISVSVLVNVVVFIFLQSSEFSIVDLLIKDSFVFISFVMQNHYNHSS